jgi:hypothetical protein
MRRKAAKHAEACNMDDYARILDLSLVCPQREREREREKFN